MALCLANSLVARHGFVLYDQLVRYKWWYQHGYMSSNGHCFDIGSGTRQSLDKFIRRQHAFAKNHKIPVDKLDYLSDYHLLEGFNVYCSKSDVAGNGALMRLAPVPLFFYKHRDEAIEFSGRSGKITHGDTKAYDACRYYGALIFATLNNYTKEDLLDKRFYEKHKPWFGNEELCDEIKTIAAGSYQREGGYKDGIRGKGYIVNALEAALWAFWSDDNNFEKGVLAAVNLGDDTDTTAAIYGQLAGAYYGYKNLPEKWVEQVYAQKFILQLSKWIAYEGKNWEKSEVIPPSNQYAIGTVNSGSVDDLLSDGSAVSYSQTRSGILPETVPPQRKPEDDKSVHPAMNSFSSSASTQDPLCNNDRTTDQNTSSQLQNDDANTSCNPWKLIPNREQSPNKNSSSKSRSKNPKKKKSE
jgi:ADP-ribosylglycohydrolase